MPGGEGGSPGGRPGEQHGGPHHVGHQEDKEVRRLNVLIATDMPESLPKSKKSPNLNPNSKFKVQIRTWTVHIMHWSLVLQITKR